MEYRLELKAKRSKKNLKDQDEPVIGEFIVDTAVKQEPGIHK